MMCHDEQNLNDGQNPDISLCLDVTVQFWSQRLVENPTKVKHCKVSKNTTVEY